jgi:hypothetical protein
MQTLILNRLKFDILANSQVRMMSVACKLGGELSRRYCCRRAEAETERAPKLLGSKFMKQASSDSEESSPKAEHREQRGPSLYTI